MYPTSISSLPPQPFPILPDLRNELPDSLTPWRISKGVFDKMRIAPSSKHYKMAQVLPTDKEWELVWKLFHDKKPTKYGLKEIYCVHSKDQMKMFEGALSSIEQEAEKFAPTWKQEPRADQRAEVMQRWEAISKIFAPFQKQEGEDRQTPWNRTKVLLLWHGSSREKCDSICASNFAFFGKTSIGAKQSGDPQSTDEGYFGSGIYLTNSPRYAADVYSNGELILAWVSVSNPFPVVGDFDQSDMKALKGKGAYKSYNAHYVPVVPAQPNNPNCTVYYPCKKGEVPTCDEIVVFQKSQTLPRFRVVLQVEAPYLLSPSNGPRCVSELIPHILKILQNPDVDRDVKLRKVFNEELAVLLNLNGDEKLHQDHVMLFLQLTQLIDSTGKINNTVRAILTSDSQTLQTSSNSFVPPTSFSSSIISKVEEIQPQAPKQVIGSSIVDLHSNSTSSAGATTAKNHVKSTIVPKNEVSITKISGPPYTKEALAAIYASCLKNLQHKRYVDRETLPTAAYNLLTEREREVLKVGEAAYQKMRKDKTMPSPLTIGQRLQNNIDYLRSS